MIDLTNPDKLKFNDMPKEAQWALIGAWHRGEPIQVYDRGWIDRAANLIAPGDLGIYRLAPETTPLVVHHWWALPDWVQWVARDEDGSIFGYAQKPTCDPRMFISVGDICDLHVSPAIIDPGTCDWREAIAQRPQEGKE